MADIKQITIPNGNSTATYNIKDAAALHNANDFSSTTITPISGLETYTTTLLSSSDLTSNGTVTLQLGSVSNNVGTNTTTTTTDYRLNLSNVIAGLTATARTAATISGLTSNGQTVLTGIAAS